MTQYVKYLEEVKVSNLDGIEGNNNRAVAIFRIMTELKKQIDDYVVESDELDANSAMLAGDNVLIDEMITKFQ